MTSMCSPVTSVYRLTRGAMLAGVLFGLVGTAEATTINVSMLGADSGGCGAASSPCRTISQAITNAVAGETIIVGPGRYGDLNGDGDFADPGEESSGVSGKMIVVNKQLTVLSRDGAGSTLIENASVANVTAVSIEADGVFFGKKKKGFTIRGGATNSTGLATTGTTMAVQIAGNVIDRHTTLVVIDGTAHQVKNNVITQGTMIINGTGHTVKDNVAEGGNFAAGATSSGLIIDRNTAIRSAGDGFDLQGTGNTVMRSVASSNASGNGFVCHGTCTGLVLTDNVARLNNGIGFAFTSGSGHVLTGNLASSNNSTGFDFVFGVPTAVTLIKNTASGNGGFGVRFGGASDATNFPNMQASAVIGNVGQGILVNGNATVQKSSLFGNDAGAANCGIDKISFGGAVDAERNFWGVAGGPSFTEPADSICSNPASIDATLPAPSEIRVTVQKLP